MQNDRKRGEDLAFGSRDRNYIINFPALCGDVQAPYTWCEVDINRVSAVVCVQSHECCSGQGI